MILRDFSFNLIMSVDRRMQKSKFLRISRGGEKNK